MGRERDDSDGPSNLTTYETEQMVISAIRASASALILGNNREAVEGICEKLFGAELGLLVSKIRVGAERFSAILPMSWRAWPLIGGQISSDRLSF